MEGPLFWETGKGEPNSDGPRLPAWPQRAPEALKIGGKTCSRRTSKKAEPTNHRDAKDLFPEDLGG